MILIQALRLTEGRLIFFSSGRTMGKLEGAPSTLNYPMVQCPFRITASKDLGRAMTQFAAELYAQRIVYSVRIGPPQPKNPFPSIRLTNPATIRLDNLKLRRFD